MKHTKKGSYRLGDGVEAPVVRGVEYSKCMSCEETFLDDYAFEKAEAQVLPKRRAV